MKIQEEVLDGKYNGISVEAIGNDGKRELVINKNRRTAKLFDNIEAAECISKTMVKGVLKFYINIKNKKFKFDNCQYVNGEYQYYNKKEDTMYYIKEKKMHKCLNLGYIVFENGDTERCDRIYGKRRQKELIKYTADMASMMLFDDKETFNKILIKNPNTSYQFCIKNSTTKIHLVSNSRLMDINQERKLAGLRCIPYIKAMDKFTTLFVYTTIDHAEQLKPEYNAKTKELINRLADNLAYCYPDLNVKYVPVEFMGTIETMEE